MKRFVFLLLLVFSILSGIAQNSRGTEAKFDSTSSYYSFTIADSGWSVIAHGTDIIGINGHDWIKIDSLTDSTITFHYTINVDWCQRPVFHFTLDFDNANVIRITPSRLDDDYQICHGDNTYSYTVTCHKSDMSVPDVKGVGFSHDTSFTPIPANPKR